MMGTGEEAPLPGTAWNEYLNSLRHGTTTGSHLSNATTTTAALLDAANLSDYLYEYLDEEDYKQYGPSKKKSHRISTDPFSAIVKNNVEEK
ncbi:uncharacterized protein AAGF69_009958 isoform 2-T2 [Amazona ochrocephala]